MTRSRHFMDGQALVSVGAIIAMAVVWAGCARKVDPIDTRVRIEACDISSDSIRKLTRRAFTDWARRLSYDPQDRSWGWAYGFDPSDSVRVFRARGMDRVTRAQLADGCVIARVSSRRANRQLGLAVGWTYIWADSSSPFVASAVPEDPTAPVVGQNMSIAATQPDPLSVQSPRHICSGCGRDWCVYPTDTLRAQPVEFAPEKVGLLELLGGRGGSVASGAGSP